VCSNEKPLGTVRFGKRGKGLGAGRLPPPIADLRMSKESEVLESLKGIVDPDLGKDIVTLGFVKNLRIAEDGSVAFDVELTTPACPVKEQFEDECKAAVSKLPWVRDVQVTMTAQRRENPLRAQAPGLKGVQHIVAVSSCKGGVGKSTVACNLAFTLSRSGASVGIFDADVYGPSLPTLVQLEETDVYQKNNLIQPLLYEGVRLMSFGYLPKRPGSEAAIMRGPMVTQVINQLLTGTEWGELDYLVVDMPPGTGDVQLTLTQVIPITAAIIVTTPQQLSFIDVDKGIQMFDKVRVPTVAVVENMSYFQPEPEGRKYFLFGKGARRKLIEQYGFEHTFELPILPEVAELSDAGRPVVLEDPDGTVAVTFREIAESVVREISTVEFGGLKTPELAYDAKRGIVLTMPDANVFELDPVDVRARCRCARCVHEFSGEQLLKKADIPAGIYPESIEPVGNYAVSIQWSHGDHASIYPYRALEEMVSELEPVVNAKSTFDV